MKRKTTVFALSLLIILTWAQLTFAAAVDSERAMLVAGNYLTYVVKTFNRWEGQDPIISSIEPVEYKGETVFWLVKVDPAGYMLVSSRDELSPVKMYSETGSFQPSRVDNPNAPESWIIPLQHSSVSYYANAGTKTTSSISPDSAVAQRIDEAWGLFESTSYTTSSKMADATPKASQIGPVISARWGQDSPYNQQVPGASGCTNSLVGCVPLAWSMLLRHWEWPDRGVGSKTYTWNGQDYTVNFGEQTWNWDAMPDELTSGSTQTQINAVCELTYQMGVVTEASWGCYSTGSNYYADQLLDVYFKYKSSMEQHAARNSDAATWFGYFKTELDAVPPRPIVMSIFDATGGHEILADGYQDDVTDKVHLNMGWYGSDNGWYDVTSDFASGGYTWIASDSVIVTGIEPDYSLRETTAITPATSLLLQ